MGRRAEVALYRIYATEKSHQYVRIVRSGRGWTPNTEAVGKPGSFYLRYIKNGRRTFESVGDDLQVALHEQKNRSQALSSPPPLTIISPRQILRDAVSDFLKDKAEATRYILGVFGSFYGWDRQPGQFQRADFKAFARHLATLDLRPRTRKNYLGHVCTFFRGTGRVVLVARNEQDATIKKATAIIPNTLVLTQADFPIVNKGIKDFYSAAQVKSLFAAAKNLRELLMLTLFYYTGGRENEVSHLFWSDVRWDVQELLVREKQQLNWTTKTHQDRLVEIPDDLMAVLNWAVGGAGVLAKHALVSVILPGSHRRTLSSANELFPQKWGFR
jgi:hypothetical protein